MSVIFGGRLVVAASDCVARTYALLHEKRLDLVHWIEPFSDGFMWDLAWGPNLAAGLRANNCTNSLLQEYRDALLLGDDPLSREPAKHICFVSRQDRGQLGQGSRLRNLDTTAVVSVLQRVGGAVFLAPGYSASTNILDPGHSSILGQMLYVNTECGVLLGVHGAGITHSLALKPGAAVVELQIRWTKYEYFNNVAAQVHVEYSRFNVDGSGFWRKNEWDMTLSESSLQELESLLQEKLAKSVHNQRQWLDLDS
jgi:Glycosyltransferase 61